MLFKIVKLFIFIVIFYPKATFALLPKEIVVVANNSDKKGLELAYRYIRARGLPIENLFQVNLGMKEVLQRADYNRKLVHPLRKFLARLHNGDRIRCLLLMYGMPLKVDAPPLTRTQKDRLAYLTRTIVDLRLELSKINYKSGEEEERLNVHLKKASLEKNQLDPAFRRAALDSELMLMLVKEYPLNGWQLNPFFLGFKGQKNMIDKNHVLMVSRLDGLNPGMVVSILADTFATEQKGLKGCAHFKAYRSNAQVPSSKGHNFYTQSILKTAQKIRETDRLPVILDQGETKVQSDNRLPTALYCGWYNLESDMSFVNWARGAVGYHIAAIEYSILSKTNSRMWTSMIKKGVAATIGSMEEPYIEAFPVPSIFFFYLVEGKLSLSESYLISLPYLSWKIVLIGDPLYRPFAAFNKAG